LERVSVPVPGRPYEVVVGAGVLDRIGELLPELPGAEVAFVVTDPAVADRVPALASGLEPRRLRAVPLPVPAGEEAKTLDVYRAVVQQLAAREAHRDDLVVALGGGAVGDLAGFAASTYMRGMPLAQVPTTLTGQVDAAIGGKTAVNLPEGKNLVGTFHQPRLVLADVETLATLPERHLRSGLAEVAKVALTLDPELLERLERDPVPVVARDPEALTWVVARCAAAKARVVAGDEREAGPRMVLNYGHTLGHAIERLEAYAGRTHGEAVAVGMEFAARLAVAHGLAAADLVGRTRRLLASLGLDPDGALPSVGAIEQALRLDKKFRGVVRFVLLAGVGRPVVVDDVPMTRVREVLLEMGAPP
jgi:3-dehydroquinate synthase